MTSPPSLSLQVSHNDGRPPLPDPGDNHHTIVLNDIIRWCWSRNARERPGSGDLLKTFIGLMRVFVGNPEQGVAPLDVASPEVSGMLHEARSSLPFGSSG